METLKLNVREPMPDMSEQLLAPVLQALSEEMASFGIELPYPTDFSMQKFFALPVNRQQEVLDQIATYASILAAGRNAKSTLDSEKASLRNALRVFGLHSRNDEVFGALDEGDVIEIYDGEGRQLYRNAAFCRISSYHLIDLAVNSWADLYDRPQVIMTGLYDRGKEALTTMNGVSPYLLPEHILRERFIYAKSKRAFLVAMKRIAPLYDENGDRAAFFSTLRADILSEADGEGRITIF